MRSLATWILAAALACGPAAAQAAGDTLVLIVSADSPVTHLDVLDLRKLFLGLSVRRENLALHAFANRSSERLQEAFLQNVVGMPAATYERRLLALQLQQGARRPAAFDSVVDLAAAVAADPAAISIAWLADVAANRRLRVLRVLWRD